MNPLVDRLDTLKTTTLNDRRDLIARMRVRFLWCTLPLLLATLFAAANGELEFFLNPLFLIPLIMPIAGGAVDWFRLRLRAVSSVAA